MRLLFYPVWRCSVNWSTTGIWRFRKRNKQSITKSGESTVKWRSVKFSRLVASATESNNVCVNANCLVAISRGVHNKVRCCVQGGPKVNDIYFYTKWDEITFLFNRITCVSMQIASLPSAGGSIIKLHVVYRVDHYNKVRNFSGFTLYLQRYHY